MTQQPDFSTARPGASGPSLWPHLALAVCALAAIVAAAQAYQARVEAQTAASRLAGVDREVEAARARVLALQAGARSAAAGGVLPEDAPPARIVSELAAVLPDHVRLERLSIDYRRGGALELLVVARDAGAWDSLLQRLEAAAHIREVEPGPEARVAEVRSLVRARWVPGVR